MNNLINLLLLAVVILVFYKDYYIGTTLNQYTKSAECKFCNQQTTADILAIELKTTKQLKTVVM